MVGSLSVFGLEVNSLEIDLIAPCHVKDIFLFHTLFKEQVCEIKFCVFLHFFGGGGR